MNQQITQEPCAIIANKLLDMHRKFVELECMHHHEDTDEEKKYTVWSVKSLCVYYEYLAEHCDALLKYNEFVLPNFYNAHYLLVLFRYDPHFNQTFSAERTIALAQLSNALMVFCVKCDMLDVVTHDQEWRERCPEYREYMWAVKKYEFAKPETTPVRETREPAVCPNAPRKSRRIASANTGIKPVALNFEEVQSNVQTADIPTHKSSPHPKISENRKIVNEYRKRRRVSARK